MKIGFLVVALFLVGCGGAEGDGSTDAQCATSGDAGAAADLARSAPGSAVCEAGRVAECPCAGGETGIQTCASNGSKWEACACPDPVMTTPQNLCTGNVDVSAYEAAGECPKEKHFPWKSCASAITASGVCVPLAGFFCCPT